jgi:hypothetical protein
LCVKNGNAYHAEDIGDLATTASVLSAVSEKLDGFAVGRRKGSS